MISIIKWEDEGSLLLWNLQIREHLLFDVLKYGEKFIIDRHNYLLYSSGQQSSKFI